MSNIPFCGIINSWAESPQPLKAMTTVNFLRNTILELDEGGFNPETGKTLPQLVDECLDSPQLLQELYTKVTKGEA